MNINATRDGNDGALRILTLHLVDFTESKSHKVKDSTKGIRNNTER